MRVLFLVQKEQRILLDHFYASIAAHCDCDLRWLSDEEQADLRGYFRRAVPQPEQYDRILLFLRFKKQLKQVAFIRSLPNLVELEHDAYQNFIPCKYTGKFSRYYQAMPHVRVLVSGAGVARRLREEGVDAVFVPKGYDDSRLRDLGLVRDIELGFVGSLGSVAYSGRKQLLEDLARVEPLLITKTRSGEEYLQTLNRIRFFVGADVGMGEYMIKNFEAMACGCLLFTFDQGEEENRALGFEDGVNVVLYRSLDELREKLARLRADPPHAAAIARAGEALARHSFAFGHLGARVVSAITPALRPAVAPGFLQRLLARLGR
ncbi:glycosyltransferase family protein [Pseudomonas sp. EpS/L25]|uniref:glycosyltransferase family protein n=1 Tax=Pseudomonas sp. EpS/L25 TaxID=1749078 RepID=UPI0007435795|nr:glycosyltransferase [Pseudomonas sp. EpS/L25]KUM44913.1 glycosyltransferase [Pseudomonas sp. EpS/L25]